MAVVFVAERHVVTVEQVVVFVVVVAHHDVLIDVHVFLSIVLVFKKEHGAVFELVHLHDARGEGTFSATHLVELRAGGACARN